MIKAPCGESVSIGDYKSNNTTVSITQNPPEDLLFEKYPFKTSGLIGNQAFTGRAIVTIEIRDSYMRFIEPKPSM